MLVSVLDSETTLFWQDLCVNGGAKLMCYLSPLLPSSLPLGGSGGSSFPKPKSPSSSLSWPSLPPALAVMETPIRLGRRWAGEAVLGRCSGELVGGAAGRGRGLSASTGSTTRKGWCAADAVRAVVLYAASIRSRVSTKFWTG
jgi:hypothetical protein